VKVECGQQPFLFIDFLRRLAAHSGDTGPRSATAQYFCALSVRICIHPTGELSYISPKKAEGLAMSTRRSICAGALLAVMMCAASLPGEPRAQQDSTPAVAIDEDDIGLAMLSNRVRWRLRYMGMIRPRWPRCHVHCGSTRTSTTCGDANISSPL
jgi:hypothetical protein